MKKHFLLFLLLLSFSGFAQQTINNYKYVIVPEKFDFLKQKDQYNLNSLTKLLLEDKGFIVYYDNSDLPNEISGNKCKALNLEVIGKSNMFSTILTLVLKDCKGKVIFKSKEGKSREKEYDVSYNLALRDAFSSLNDVKYEYKEAVGTSDEQPIAAAATVATVVAPTAHTAVKAITADTIQTAGTLYAQQTTNGYQLIDTAPKIVLTLFKTSMDNYFIAENASSHGTVFKKNDNWVFEYYQNGKLKAEKLLIKF